MYLSAAALLRDKDNWAPLNDDAAGSTVGAGGLCCSHTSERLGQLGSTITGGEECFGLQFHSHPLPFGSPSADVAASFASIDSAGVHHQWSSVWQMCSPLWCLQHF